MSATALSSNWDLVSIQFPLGIQFMATFESAAQICRRLFDGVSFVFSALVFFTLNLSALLFAVLISTFSFGAEVVPEDQLRATQNHRS